MTRLKLKSDIFKSSSNFFDKFVLILFHIYIKICKNLSAKYHQENKERVHKKLVKNIKIFQISISKSMALNVTKISPKPKYKSLLSMEKIVIE